MGPPETTTRRGELIPLSVAPMMDKTDRHYRALMRQITRRTLLYTEMITAQAVQHGRAEALLGFDLLEKPLALQLGGDDPVALVAAARIAEAMGYDEVNLNVGCPSDRVQSGRFGACLMAHPELVAEAVSALRAAVRLPVTVKHRIGIDDRDRYEDLLGFVDVVARAGCDRFTVHARKAWLSGLSPKENRTVPPLRYTDVYRLKAERPHLAVELNGGVLDLEAAQGHLEQVDAVMIGRAAYDTPMIFAGADRLLGDANARAPTAEEVVSGLFPYAAALLARGQRLHRLTRHMLGLFPGRPGARAYKRILSTEANRPGAGLEVLEAALAALTDARGRAGEAA